MPRRIRSCEKNSRCLHRLKSVPPVIRYLSARGGTGFSLCWFVYRFFHSSILFALLLASQSWCEPQHMLQWVLPRGGTRGTTVEVNLHGIYRTTPHHTPFSWRVST